MSLISQRLSRRDLLRLTAMTTAGVAIVACAPAATTAPDAAAGGESAPSTEAVDIIATTSMPVNTFDKTLERAKDQIANVLVSLVIRQSVASETMG